MASTSDQGLPEAVAGIAAIVPRAPEGLLAQRLRTPLLALSIGLAVGLHASGVGALLVLGWGDGGGGRLAGGLGANIIEIDIIDGLEKPAKGGRVEEAVTGIALPLATASIDQTAAAPRQEPAPVKPEPAKSAAVEPEADKAPGPPLMIPQEILATPLPAEIQVAAAVPPPPFTLDPTLPPAIQPAPEPTAQPSPRPIPEPAEKKPAQQRAEDVPKNALAEPAPNLEPSRASLGGDGATAQAVTETAGTGGEAAASRGEIASYHNRLRTHIAANRPISRGRLGKVVVHFEIEGNGSLRDAKILESTGNSDLETKSLAAIRKASPYPRPPRGMTGKALQFTVPFTFYQ